jgi:hypothetical protein
MWIADEKGRNAMRHLRTLMLAAALVGGAPQVAAAACTPYLAYFDLGAGGGTILGGTGIYTQLQSGPVATTPYNPISACPTPAAWRAVVAKVDVPAGCTGMEVWVQYDGEPSGFTLNVGDSETDNGFGGDAGSLPAGQNAELQVLNDDLSVYNAGSVAANVGQLANQQLALKDGALNVVVKDQFVSWGEPYGALSTPGIQQLFFLPPAPVTAPANRTLYVSFNRVIDPVSGPDGARNGCGARRALIVLR